MLKPFEPLGLYTKNAVLESLAHWNCDPDIKLPRKGRALYIALPIYQVAIRITKQGKGYLVERGGND